MKSIKVILIGFILAVALVAWPAGYMQYITAGICFLLAAVLMALSRPGCSVVKWTGGFVGRSRTRMSGGRGE